MAQYKDVDAILRQLDEFYITAIVQQKHDDVPEDHKKHWKGVQSGINYARNTLIEAPTADVAPKSEWISVEDRLPEKFTDVLCLYPSKNHGSNVVVIIWNLIEAILPNSLDMANQPTGCHSPHRPQKRRIDYEN